MPCIPLPIQPLPTVPEPFSLAPPALPQLPLQVGVCCQSLNLGDFVPTLSLPPLVLNPGVVAAIRAGVQVVQTYLDHLPIDCPRS